MHDRYTKHTMDARYRHFKQNGKLALNDLTIPKTKLFCFRDHLDEPLLLFPLWYNSVDPSSPRHRPHTSQVNNHLGVLLPSQFVQCPKDFMGGLTDLFPPLWRTIYTPADTNVSSKAQSSCCGCDEGKVTFAE